jgi:hypothetical protein
MTSGSGHPLQRGVLCLLLLTLLAVSTSPGFAVDIARGLVVESAKIEPLTPEQATDLNPEHAAGIFLGINDFEDEDLAQLNFAVDDAVDVAYLFSEELKLISPRNVWLSLGGKPKKAESITRLERLLKDGAKTKAAGYFDFLGLLDTVPPKTRSQGLLVVHISSHGFDDGRGNGYVMLQNSLTRHLEETAVRVTKIQEAIRTDETTTHAARRLVFIDACRNKALSPKSARAAGTGSDAAEVFKQNFMSAKGQGTLSAADVGSYSYEDDKFQQGVFTHFILEGLRGKVPGDEVGLIRLGDLASWVGAQVQEYTSTKSRPQITLPMIPPDAWRIPLAYDANKGAAYNKMQEELRGRKNAALDLLNNAQKLHRDLLRMQMVTDIEDTVLKTESAEKLSELLPMFNMLKDPTASSVKHFVKLWHLYSTDAPSVVPIPDSAPTLQTAEATKKNETKTDELKNLSISEIRKKKFDVDGQITDLMEEIKDVNAKLHYQTRISQSSTPSKETERLQTQKKELTSKLEDLNKEQQRLETGIQEKLALPSSGRTRLFDQ